MRDPYASAYIRQEQTSGLIGIYEHENLTGAWEPHGYPAWDSDSELFPKDLDRIMPWLSRAMDRMPMLWEVEIKRIVTGGEGSGIVPELFEYSFGMAPEEAPTPAPKAPPLIKGPAYAKILTPHSSLPIPHSSWSSYRHDAARTGATTAPVAKKLAPLWQTEIGGRPTAPTAGYGMAFVKFNGTIGA